ncbi:DUF599 domain-containing protein [Tropicimonas sp. IMCC34043]|uniref:DUF599 domain-containing protein n=1 Tax=Tropicimonas sp. IMCC34043 TaxID=2248760 RepID=UPI000E27D8C5|nr:DUF599 domain-containing protein [Tropicimonas sp. IMCC34043]
MNIVTQFDLLSPLDLAALALLLICIFGLDRLVEHSPARFRSVSYVMRGYRAEWMRHMVTRQPRIFDSAILGTLRQGTTFFASSSIIAIGGALALMSNPQTLNDLAGDLTKSQAPAVLWEIKMLLIVLLLISAFLRFVWAHRLFGYAAVLMAAVPNDPEDPLAFPRAAKAGDLSSLAGRSFNRGMRSVYFSLGATGWLIGAAPLMLTTLAITAMILRREFGSNTRVVLMRPED